MIATILVVLYLALPTSLPYIRDSVSARSITPVIPTRWFLVPDSTPCSELKTSAVRRGQTYPKEAAVILQYCLLPHQGFAGSECTGEKGEHIRAISQTLLCKVIHLRLLLDLHNTCVLFHRLLAVSYHLSSNFSGKTLPPDGGYTEADGR